MGTIRTFTILGVMTAPNFNRTVTIEYVLVNVSGVMLLTLNYCLTDKTERDAFK